MSYAQIYADHVINQTLERGQIVSGITGEIAAAASSGDKFFTLRYPETTPMPGSARNQGKRLCVERIRLRWHCLTAFTDPTTASRHLELRRGVPTSGTANDPSGGSAITTFLKRSDNTVETAAVGRIASTATLTVSGYTFSGPAAHMLLAGKGASGDVVEDAWLFDGHECDPIYLLPGELIVIRAGADFDAAGTWQLSVGVDCCEIVGS